MKIIDLSKASSRLARNPRLVKAVLMLSENMPVSEVAREAGVSKATLYRWKKALERDISNATQEANLRSILILLLWNAAKKEGFEDQLRSEIGNLYDLIRDLTDSIVLTVEEKPIAALIPVDDEDLESYSLSRNPKFLAIIEKSRKSIKEKGTISSKEMWSRFGM